MIASGWQAAAQIWAAVLVLTALAFWALSKDGPVITARCGTRAPLPRNPPERILP